MKFTLASDLHFEFSNTGSIEAVKQLSENISQSDVLLLSGDIIPVAYLYKGEASPKSKNASDVLTFLSVCSLNYSKVIYILGNHEYYDGYLDLEANRLKDKIGHFITVLDNEYIDIENIRIIGSTLWTSMNNRNPITENIIRYALNDYKYIQSKKDYRKIRPIDTQVKHTKAVNFIKSSLSETQKNLVMTHHAPSYNSVHPKYHNDTQVNYAYYSDLEEFIYDSNISAWTHGHMHDNFAYSIGDTTVYCNPKGYGHENKYFNPSFNFEL